MKLAGLTDPSIVTQSSGDMSSKVEQSHMGAVMFGAIGVGFFISIILAE